MAEERIFRTCILAGLRPAGLHSENNLILTSGKFRTSGSAFPARSIFTTFCHQKVVPKVSAGRKAAGNSQRLAKTGACRGFASKPAPFFNARRCSFLFPHFSQGGDCCALRATMIYYDSNSSILKFSKPPRAEASARAAPHSAAVLRRVDNTPPR